MQTDRSLKFLFIVNPHSGGIAKNEWLDAIRDFFDEKPHSIHFYHLNGKNDAEEIRQHIKAIEPDRVIAVGGDGTVNLVAQNLMGSGIPLGILPAGSANGLATELQLPEDQEAALEVLENGAVLPLDVVCINDNIISLHLADLGINAQLIKYFEESNWRGKLGYAKVLFKTLWRNQKVRVQIKTDQETIIRKVYMVVLANARTYGTGAAINPEGDLTDGEFEVVIVRKLALSELLKMIFRHKTFDRKKVEVLKTKNVQLTSNRKTYFQADGEYLGKMNVIRAKILPAQLEILVPST